MINDAATAETSESDCLLTALRMRFPKASFLALGQTALWDEPTKAALRLRLDRVWPEATIVAGVHDTDYFAKLPGHPANFTHSAYAVIPHDDHKTRGLWSAAGEMSRFFGSEDVPTRALLRDEAGVSLKIAERFVTDSDALLTELTEAWGWTGIIHAGWERQIAAEVKLSEILPTLLEQVAWATENSPVGQTIMGWISAFATANPEATLPCLYATLLPKLYGLLLNAEPKNLETTRTTELLKFNTRTCTLPRFWLVQAFLDPATRASARDAYDLAVAGGEQYGLDAFGPGARPFDLVVPGRGRGTLRVRADGSVWIDTPEPIHLPGERVVTSVRMLAERIEAALGPDCVLIGKAVALLPMLTAEWVLVFHEGASAYSDRTQAMLRELKRQRVAVPTLRPIMRVRYHTWDSLAALGSQSIALPPHLSQALGRGRLDADDLATCWHSAITWERARLHHLRGLRSPRALLAMLAERDDYWRAQADAYASATQTLLACRDAAKTLQDQIDGHYSQIRAYRAELAAIQQAKGDDFRARGGVLDGTAEQERAVQFDAPMQRLRERVQQSLTQVRLLKTERLTLERAPETLAARELRQRIEAEAERARARLAKNALQTVHGLPHTDFRPSAWWFPQLDPSGAWFERVAETMELRLEELAP